MIEASVKLEGFNEWDLSLARLEANMQRKAMRKAVLLGGKALLKETKKLAPKDTGFLRRDLKAFLAKKRQPGLVRGIVGIPRKITKRRRAAHAAGEVRYAGAWYAMLINYGFRTKNGRFIQGTHFMDRAFSAKKSEVVSITEKEFKAAIDSAVKK